MTDSTRRSMLIGLSAAADRGGVMHPWQQILGWSLLIGIVITVLAVAPFFIAS